MQLSVDVVSLRQELEGANRQLDAARLANRSKLSEYGLQVRSTLMYGHRMLS